MVCGRCTIALSIVVFVWACVFELTRREFNHATRASQSRPIVLFDGVCGLCDMFVDASMHWADTEHGVPFKFAPLQSDLARRVLWSTCHLDENDLSSVVVVEDGVCFRQSAAALRVVARWRAPFPAVHHAFMVVPPVVRDAVYNLIASNRYAIFGTRDQCRAPTSADQQWFETDSLQL